MAKKTQTVHPVYTKLVKHFSGSNKGKDPIKMKDLCVKLRLCKRDDPVPSALSAMVRLQLKKLVDAKLVKVSGTKATTTYCAR